MKNKFTLIELVVVIAVLGILSAIIIPNVSHMQHKSSLSASIADMRILQTASDMYSVEHLQFASVEQPTSKMPQSLDFSKVYEGYIRSLPKGNHYYWIDVLGKVWSSPIDAPKLTSITGNHVTWEGVPGAVSYQIYEILNKKTISNLRSEQVYYKKVVTLDKGILVYNGDATKSYAVSSIHKDGYESAPIGDLNYKYIDTLGIHRDDTNTPTKHPVSSIRMSPETGVTTKTPIVWDHDSVYADGTIDQLEWKVDGVIVPAPPTHFTSGTHTVELRVQGSNGVWSNTSSKSFDVQFENTFDNITAMAFYSMVLHKDGTVWGWGQNSQGQLGDGTTIDRVKPTKVDYLTGVKKVVNNSYSSVALKKDGTVWAWGQNAQGQLGDGTKTRRLTPVQVIGLTDVKDIVSGYHHTFAIKMDGTVWGWGDNTSGQLGIGTKDVQVVPVQIQELENIKQIASGSQHNIALKNDGTVIAWGQNANGQLGDGTNLERLTPVPVTGLTDVKELSAGGLHSFAIKNDGSVWAWGYNYYGGLGDGTTINRFKPVLISSLSNIKKVVGGTYHSIAIQNDGTILTWGANSEGQLGNGTKVNHSTPTPIPNLTHIVDISAGLYHSLAVDEKGDLRSWGGNNYGQLGNESKISHDQPVQVSNE